MIQAQKTKSAMNNPSQSIILFDGVCNLCNGAVQFIIKRDPKAKFTLGSLQSESGQQLLHQYNLPLNDFDSFIYIKDGKALRKSTGALHVMKELGGIWQFFFAFIVIPRPVRDYFYSLIAKNRYSYFGKSESCMLPSPELKERFLP